MNPLQSETGEIGASRGSAAARRHLLPGETLPAVLYLSLFRRPTPLGERGPARWAMSSGRRARCAKGRHLANNPAGSPARSLRPPKTTPTSRSCSPRGATSTSAGGRPDQPRQRASSNNRLQASNKANLIKSTDAPKKALGEGLPRRWPAPSGRSGAEAAGRLRQNSAPSRRLWKLDELTLPLRQVGVLQRSPGAVHQAERLAQVTRQVGNKMVQGQGRVADSQKLPGRRAPGRAGSGSWEELSQGGGS